jgi:hypothetical protein
VNMLHGAGCNHLSTLHSLAASTGTSALESVPAEVQKLTGSACPEVVENPWLRGGCAPIWE